MNSWHTYVFVPIQPEAMSPHIHCLEDNHLHVHKTPFYNFLLLSHYSHLYSTIVNAYRKFTKMSQEQIRHMPEEHRELRTWVNAIHFM
jgi:hypothetical protein